MQARKPNGILVIDVSAFQGIIDWPRVAKAGAKLVFIRATMGATGRDADFARNVREAKAAGVLVIAYVFSYPATSSAIADADALLQVSAAAGGVDGYAIDVERAGVPAFISCATLTQYIKDFYSRIHQRTGKVSLLYGSTSFLATRTYPAQLWFMPLWLAEYGVSVPGNVGAWRRWTFWQYSDQGHIPGISGNVDLDAFDGTLSDLHNFISKKGGSNTVTLQNGSTGSAVKTMQEMLKTVLGLGSNFALDGDFGPQTEAAVKSFQTQYNLSVDGIYGPKTEAALKAAYSKATTAPSRPAQPPAVKPPDSAPTSQPATNLQQAEQTFESDVQTAVSQEVSSKEQATQAAVKKALDLLVQAEAALKGVQ